MRNSPSALSRSSAGDSPSGGFPPFIYRAFFWLVLQRLDSERAHATAEFVMRVFGKIPGATALMDWILRPRDEALVVEVAGLKFRSPLGMAAGFDKCAKWFDELAAFGYGSVEVGTITAEGQPGNSGRRISRLIRDRALLNAMGFPNDGAEAAAARLARRRTRAVIGANIGKTMTVPIADAVADYRRSARILAPFADYLVLNVSSPNTPGLTGMQTVETLTGLIAGIRGETAKSEIPLMIKLGPDLHDAEIEQIADMALRLRLDGIVAVNTTTNADVAPALQAEIEAKPHKGGISGRPLKQRACEVLELLHARTKGEVPLISVGGIETPEDAWLRILAGASLVQAHTAFIYEGPLWPRRMHRGISRLLRESEWASLPEAVGKKPVPFVVPAAHSKSTRAASGAPSFDMRPKSTI